MATVADIAARARRLAQFNVPETDPFTDAEWNRAVNEAHIRMWNVFPEAFFVSGRVCAMPVLPQSATSAVAVLDTWEDRLAAAAAKSMVASLPAGEDKTFEQERVALVARLEQMFLGGANGAV